jgi:hypothetical protein
MRTALSSVAILAVCLVFVARVFATGRTTPWLVTAPSQSNWRLGDLRFYASGGKVYTNPESLLGTIRAFGKPDSCQVTKDWYAVATWKRMGVVGYFTTLGGFPPHNGKPQNGCAQPTWVQPDNYLLIDRRWYTSRGLRIGSSVNELVRLYPNAEKHGDSFWLNTRPTPWMLGPKKKRHLGLLIADVKDGAVHDLDLSLQAQGE